MDKINWRKRECLTSAIRQERKKYSFLKQGQIFISAKTAAKNCRNVMKLLLARQIEGGIKHLGVDNYNEGVSARTCLCIVL